MNHPNPLKKLILLLLLVHPLLFIGCDKDGNPLYTDKEVRMQKDDVRYIQETPLNALNKVFAPKLTYGGSWKVGEEDLRYIGFSSNLYKEGHRGNTEFRISYYLPLEGEIKLNSKYEVKPIGTEEEYTLEDPDDSLFLGTEPYLLYSSKDNKTFFGTGHIIFTKLYKENMATVAEGKIEFSIPNSNSSRSTLSGTFKLIIEGYPNN